MRKLCFLSVFYLFFSFNHANAISFLDIHVDVDSYHDQIYLDQDVVVNNWSKSLTATVFDNNGYGYSQTNGNQLQAVVENASVSAYDDRYNSWYNQKIIADIRLSTNETTNSFSAASMSYNYYSSFAFYNKDYPEVIGFPHGQYGWLHYYWDHLVFDISYLPSELKSKAKIFFKGEFTVQDFQGGSIDGIPTFWAELYLSEDGLSIGSSDQFWSDITVVDKNGSYQIEFYDQDNGVEFDPFDEGEIVNTSFNLTVSAVAIEASPVPEPATLLLLGTGLAGIAGLTRKKIKKK